MTVEAFSFAKVAAANRLKTIKNLGLTDGAIYVKGGSVLTRRWTDTEEPFRQESNFYYLTGVEDPDCHLVVSLKTQESTLLVPRYDDDYTLWCGAPPSVEALQTKHQIKVLFADELKAVLEAAAGDSKTVHVIEGEDALHQMSEVNITADRLKTAITEARVIKCQEEIELMRRAGRISGNAHIALMKTVRPGIGTERDLQATFIHECTKSGAHLQAYTGIFASGRSGSILHYTKNNAPIPANKSDLVLVDAACELACYASDITRCFPTGGKFEGDFKVVYEIVLEVQMAVLAAMKPGVLWEDMHRLAESVTCDGLLKAGIVKGNKDDLLKHHIPALFFPHGLGHLIGIDVHDCGGYPAGVERIQEPGIRYLRMRRPLVPGMVVTVEPGLYFVDPILEKALADPVLREFLNIDVLARFHKNVGGVRIEDDVAITETGIDNLTGWVPKSVADIEAIMAQ
ncbi:peptidase M24, structural domain-containing protein [Chytridium lagenaria]|nr:peptidase M24, structural domain-containing protein [Chytridium lagenaria]